MRSGRAPGAASGAERHFQAAFALGPPDARLLGTYADFLLEGR